ncbi:hypothetical protein ACFQH8_01795 [Halomicroarcula sp. GCM10025710]
MILPIGFLDDTFRDEFAELARVDGNVVEVPAVRLLVDGEDGFSRGFQLGAVFEDVDPGLVVHVSVCC